MELFLSDVVMRIVGPVMPVGDTYADGKRLTNLENLTDLIGELLIEVQSAAASCDRPEASMREIGIFARDFLAELREILAE